MQNFAVGTPSEWADFAQRNQRFLEAHDSLREAIEQACDFDLNAASPLVDRIVYLLGRGCVDDFEEIVILAGNGRGFGALKLLRGMYERYIHARHLHGNPADAQNFVDYFWVQEHKLLEQIKRAFGAELLDRPEFRTGRENAQAEYERVREKFLVKCCPNCSDKRVNHSWHKLDIVAMAAKIGGGAAAMTVTGYYVPMKHVHSTMGTIVSRLAAAGSALSYGGGVSRAESDKAVSAAHLLLLGALELQAQHFDRHNVAATVSRCLEQYEKVWPNDRAA